MTTNNTPGFELAVADITELLKKYDKRYAENTARHIVSIVEKYRGKL